MFEFYSSSLGCKFGFQEKITSFKYLLLYGSVSQGLGTNEFMDLIDWNQYWLRSRFSHLDRFILCWESSTQKYEKCSSFSFVFFSIIYDSAKKPGDKKKIETIFAGLN